MKGVILYKCGRNINRVYRLCYIYGIRDLYLVKCKIPEIGNVFSAKGRVNVHILDEMPAFEKIAALEKEKGVPISTDIGANDYIVVGGENVTLNSKICNTFFHIKTKNSLCFTVDEALAIGLEYAARQCDCR